MSTHIGPGSLAAPAYSFINDENTGIYSPAADTLAVVVGGVEVKRFKTGITEGRFVKATATLTSAAAATAVNLIPESAILSTEKVYLIGFIAKVNGATNWATTATIKIQDTNGTPVDFITTTINAATTNGNVVSYPGSNSNVALENAFILGTGGTAGKGLQVKGDANGTGSNYVVTCMCWIGP